MLDKLAAERDVYAARATLWTFLDRCALTFKKDRARGRAEPPGHPEAAVGLVRCPARSRSWIFAVHRRDLGIDQHGAAWWPRSEEASACGPAFHTAIGRRQPAGRADGSPAWSRRWFSTGRSIVRPFLAYVRAGAGPELRPGDIVIMDNLSGHKGPAVCQAIEGAGARCSTFPPYSPDFNPSRTPCRS